MRFTPEFLDEIRARLPVSEVVGRRVKLKKQGREWAGLSPFNKEKTPSFFVNDQKGFYHCFSSGKHGSIFDFVMETEGLTFPEAVERLAQQAGLELPKSAPQEIERQKRRATLHEVMDMAAAFFEAQLAASGGANARAYLERRGLSPHTRAEFRLGFAPSERMALRNHLARLDVPVADMVDAGLLISGEDVAEPFDRFRDRIMFPIHDARGRVIAFGGRAMQADVPAKYLNSPETPLFHKGGVLFNHHRARAVAHDAGTMLVVEGYMDAIALAQVGIRNVVAPLGTALTENQIDLLWRTAPEPVLCFDGDKAGRRAAHRAIDVALPHLKPGRSLRFAFLPEGQDPDDLVRAAGASAMEAVVARARAMDEVLWEREADLAPLDTPERRAALERRLGDLVRTIADESVRRHYGQAMQERFQRFAPASQAPAVYQRRPGRMPGGGGDRRGGRGPFRPEPIRASPSLRNSASLGGGRILVREAALVISLIRHPQLIERHAETFCALDFASPELDRLRTIAVDAAAHGEAESAEMLEGVIARAGLAAILARVEAALTPGLWWARTDADDLDAETGFLHSLALHQKAHALHKELRAAEAVFGQDLTEENFSRLADIQHQLRTVDGTEASIEGFGAASGRPTSSL
ncbi:DNA primase [Terrihabitans sp. B22-R8]|uniref:DNA primase n=1 Tax=Terrihabitans sp. B22-R8 TaxID=3425128 RepID=UPI00403CB209